MKVKHLTDLPSIAAYLNRIDAEPRSLRAAVVRQMNGKYWEDIAIINFDYDGTVKTNKAKYLPTDAEASLIKAECSAADWPRPVKLAALRDLPPQLARAEDKDVFVFRDLKGAIVMIHQRIQRDDKESGKNYVPWTFWDDDEWRTMEPDGKLPLWGLEQLNHFTTVFIHEGAKAARAMAEMVAAETPEMKEKLANHPWGEELSNAAHVGWIGGALSPSRTDWGIFRAIGVQRAYIVSDNDEAGLKAVGPISFRLHVPTFHLQFTSEWPKSFDLADEWPKEMFTKRTEDTFYHGPAFRSCLHPATWATDMIPNPKGKPSPELREEFKSMWSYVEEADMFVCKEMPEIIRNDVILNKIVAPFSHINNTAGLLLKAYRGRQTKLCYRPDIVGRIVTDKTTSAINLHTPTQIKPKAGDVTPWIDYLNYMFINEDERREVMKWCATLIARPDIRMEYGMLLISEMQGVGKTTLGSKVLQPLIGEPNVGFPTEEDITNSQFNSWVANKRLVIVGEIYSGHSWKAYNRLKSYITDKDIEVNEKYMKPYRHENWSHMLASSNSRKALKMEKNDRRWFYPEMTEKPWPRERFEALNNWLVSGGLSIILYWARNFGDWVLPGVRAPMTELKRKMIAASRSEAQQELADLCEAIVADDLEVALAMKEIVSWVRMQAGGRVFDTDHELKKTAVELGFKVFEKRIKVGSQMQFVLLSPALADTLKRSELEPAAEVAQIRLKLKGPHDLAQSSM